MSSNVHFLIVPTITQIWIRQNRGYKIISPTGVLVIRNLVRPGCPVLFICERDEAYLAHIIPVFTPLRCFKQQDLIYNTQAEKGVVADEIFNHLSNQACDMSCLNGAVLH